MVHHVPDKRPGAGRESVQNSVAREVLIWLIASTPASWSFPAALSPGDMALAQTGDIWIYTGLHWTQLVGSRVDDELRVKNLRVLAADERLEVEFEG